MQDLIEIIIKEAVSESNLESAYDPADLEEWMDSSDFETILPEAGGSRLPNYNPLLPGLAKVNRSTSYGATDSYREWVKRAWKSAKKGVTRRDISFKTGLSFAQVKKVVNAMMNGQDLFGWQKVEANVLVPFGSPPFSQPTLPPGISISPQPGRYYRITDSNYRPPNPTLKTLEWIALQAYGGNKIYIGARAIDNHPYNRRYWIYGPGNPYRINLNRAFECDLVKLHQKKFGYPAPVGHCHPVLFLPFESELGKWGS
jgi:hypothetical protein